METRNPRILAIDDNKDNLIALKAVLLDVLPGVSILTALDGLQGLELARLEDPDVILLDIVMPGMDGFAVCRELKTDEQLRSIPVVFLTALKTGRESRVEALEVGAEGFLAKPLDEIELVAQIRAMVKIKAANQHQRLEREQLTALVAERTRDLKAELVERVQAEAAVRRILESTIQVISMIAEIRDPYTSGHQHRVAALACAIAEELGFVEDQLEEIRVAGLLHDIGKISIPAEILACPRKLTDLEFEMIKAHPQVACDILKDIEFPWPIADIVLQHHERLDGSGYPNGLKGDEILLEARVLAVADVVEAMASHRPYRAALGIDKALEEISENRGVKYDAKVAEACLKLFAEGVFSFE